MASPEDDPLDEAPLNEAWFDEDSPSVADDLTMAQVGRQLAWFWGAVLLLAIVTGIVVKVLSG